MISRARQYSSAASSVNVTGPGGRAGGSATPPPLGRARRSRSSARHRRTHRRAAPTARTASSFAISVSIVFKLTLPASDRIDANTVGPSSPRPHRRHRRRSARASDRPNLLRQPRRDPREQHLLAAAQRRPDDPVDPAARGRLDALAAAAGQQLLTDPLTTPLGPG